MKQPKKIKEVVLNALFVSLFVLIVLPYILMLINPMRRPQSMATHYVLRLTPIGMSMEEVIRIVENHRNWDVWWISRERGFPRPPGSSNIMGEKSIAVWAGPSGTSFWPSTSPFPAFGWFFRTSVSIFWGFDEDGKLIYVFVRQSHSG